jgi:hypothetical protein
MSQEFVRDRLQVTYTALGGKEAFGCSASGVGTKSLRSSAAMALFLMNHSTERIMPLLAGGSQLLSWFAFAPRFWNGQTT